MSQPEWKLIAQLGDVHPIDYGGYFIFEDTTGVYAPEGELLLSPDTDEGTWQVYRFILEPCTFIDGILSDNKYHPDHAAWFADSLDGIAQSHGMTREELITALVDGPIAAKAMAWQAIGEYHGLDNLDSYPLTLKTRAEAEQRYTGEKYSKRPNYQI